MFPKAPNIIMVMVVTSENPPCTKLLKFAGKSSNFMIVVRTLLCSALFFNSAFCCMYIRSVNSRNVFRLKNTAF